MAQQRDGARPEITAPGSKRIVIPEKGGRSFDCLGKFSYIVDVLAAVFRLSKIDNSAAHMDGNKPWVIGIPLLQPEQKT